MPNNYPTMCMYGCGWGNIDPHKTAKHEKTCTKKPLKGGPKPFPGRPVKPVPIRDVRKPKEKKPKKKGKGE